MSENTVKEVCEILGMPYISSRPVTDDLFDIGSDESCSFVGEVSPLGIEEIVRSRTGLWVSKIDREINTLIGGYRGDRKLENGDIYHPDIDPQYLRSRFISYSEYLSLFSYATSYEKNLSYITYRAVRELVDNVPNFTSEYSNTLTGYTNFLARRSPRLREHFLKNALSYIPDSARKRHTYITGGTGSGKSEMMKILAYSTVRKNAKNPHNRSKRESLIVIDPHGELADGIAQFREHENDADLIYVDLFLKDGFSPSINPFDIPTDNQKHIELVAQEITGAFLEIIGQANLSTQMEAILEPCIATVLVKKDGSIKDLQRFMDDENNADLIELGQKSRNAAHRELFNNAFTRSTYKTTKDGIYTRLQVLLNSGVFSDFIARPSTIDLSQAMDNGTSVVFKLTQGDIGEKVCHAIGRLIVAMIKSIGLRRAKIDEHLRTPVHVFIDECQNFISPSIEKMLTESRKYGVHLTLAQQILGQGMDSATEEITLGNTGVKIVGSNSLGTLKDMSRETETELELMQQLLTGEFIVKVRNPQKPTPSFILKAPTLLLNGRNNGTNWNGVLKEQIEKYYSKVEDTTLDTEKQNEVMERQTTEDDLSGSDEDNAPKATTKAVKPKFKL